MSEIIVKSTPMLEHRLSTTSCGTSVRVKWPGKDDFEWLTRDGAKRLFSAKKDMSSEERALRFLISEYEKFFTMHTESWRESNMELAIKRADPLALAQQTFGKADELYLKGGRTVKTARIGGRRKSKQKTGEIA